jgi:hypothetical protein
VSDGIQRVAKANLPFILVDHFRVMFLCFHLENADFNHLKEQTTNGVMFDLADNGLPRDTHIA